MLLFGTMGLLGICFILKHVILPRATMYIFCGIPPCRVTLVDRDLWAQLVLQDKEFKDQRSAVIHFKGVLTQNCDFNLFISPHADLLFPAPS